MVCSICNQAGHQARTCNSELLQQSVTRIKAHWLGENMPEGWNDVMVKEWAANLRIGLPYWRRIWTLLDDEFFRKGWWRIPYAERQLNPVTAFTRPQPISVTEFKSRIQNYIRPLVLPEPPLPRPQHRPTPRRPHPGPLPSPPPSEEVQPIRIDAEVRLLRRHMEDALVMHRRRINRQLQEQQKKINRKVKLLMDQDDANYYIDDVCPICMDKVTPQTVLAFGCKHTLCANCAIDTIHKTTVGCPICRVNITEIHFKPDTNRDTFNKLSSHMCFS